MKGEGCEAEITRGVKQDDEVEVSGDGLKNEAVMGEGWGERVWG